jgi:SAM-dependent methyltransferase
MKNNPQREAFRTSEGDAWHARNRSFMEDLPERVRRDPVLRALRALELAPKSVLEVGCANGYRLEALRGLYGAECFGIEPSAAAVEDARQRFGALHVQVGTADELPFEDGRFDALIFGFCLYLCDRGDLFKIAYQADRVLADGGFLCIYDFFAPGIPYRNPYAHLPGLYSYKMDYARLFLGNPAYSSVYHSVIPEAGGPPSADPDQRIAVTVLHKNMRAAYPDNPFRR